VTEDYKRFESCNVSITDQKLDAPASQHDNVAEKILTK